MYRKRQPVLPHLPPSPPFKIKSTIHDTLLFRAVRISTHVPVFFRACHMTYRIYRLKTARDSRISQHFALFSAHKNTAAFFLRFMNHFLFPFRSGYNSEGPPTGTIPRPSTRSLMHLSLRPSFISHPNNPTTAAEASLSLPPPPPP